MKFKIDRKEYATTALVLTGEALKILASLDEDHDLWMIRPGRCDILLSGDDPWTVTEHQRFFSAPRIIKQRAVTQGSGLVVRSADLSGLLRGTELEEIL